MGSLCRTCESRRTDLLQNAIRRTLLIAEQAGIRAMLTRPIDEEAARFYYRFGFIAARTATLVAAQGCPSLGKWSLRCLLKVDGRDWRRKQAAERLTKRASNA